MKFEVYKDSSGEFRWRLKAGNGEIIATSEGYTSKQNCLKCIDLLRTDSIKQAAVKDETK